MRHLFKIVACLALMACGLTMLRAQNALRIGEWRAHLPFNTGITVTQDENNVYYGSDKALFSFTKDSLEVSFYSKVDGLSDVGINLIRYHDRAGALIVVYRNSNIDLVFPDRVVNVDDILRNNTINGSKQINHIYADDTPLVYLSCDFGLVEFNIETAKFGFTMFTDEAVRAFTRFDEAFWIASDEGIFRFDKFESEIVSNFDAWDFVGEDAGLPADYSAQEVVVFGNHLYAAANNELYRLEEGDFLFWDSRDQHYIEFLSPEGAHLKAGYRCFDDVCNGKVHFFDAEGKVGEHGFECAGLPRYAVEDQYGRVWYADLNDGVRMAENYQWGCTNFRFNTPFSSNVGEIAVKDNTVYLAAGGVSDTYNNLLRPDGFATLVGDNWSYFNRTNTTALTEYDPLDYLRIDPHPSPDTPIVFVGSYYSGLIRYNTKDSTFSFYDQSNSALQGAVGDEQRERVAGMQFDADNNLWMSCYLAPKPIVVRKADGTWKNFSVPGSTRLGDIVIDRRGYKWIAIISPSAGILVFDDNGTIDNTSDDRFKVFTTSNSNLPTNLLTNLVVDRNGDIWAGTANGPVVFNGAADPFDGSTQGFRIRVEQDGILAYLLAEEEVTSIAVDGANQKWIGTRNGVFVQSPSGETEVATFNEENSPLLDDHIIDIEINPEDGEVFIGTLSGLISFRAEAIEGKPFHNQNAFAYPNPVRPGYDGPIAIRGLAENAAVKITDVAGVVVFETRALGGQAIWDGRDLGGRRAASGVYLVFSTTESTFDKPDALVTKILMVD